MTEYSKLESVNEGGESLLTSLQGIKVGFALTGSYCTLDRAIAAMLKLRQLGADISPIISESVKNKDTRYGTAESFRDKIRLASGKDGIIDSIVLAEPIGPKALFDILIIAPCSGNTLGKLANSITDTTVLMAAKAHLRGCRPLVLAISTNDGLSGSCKNIGQLLNYKYIYFVPFGQDDPQNKHNSLVAYMELIPQTLTEALSGRQIQPLLYQYDK